MFLQVVVNGLAAGSGIALVAISFGFVYSTTRFFNFGHGVPYLAGGYTAYVLIQGSALPCAAGLIGAVVLGAASGVLTELLVYRPLRGRGATSQVLLLASIGVLVAVQSSISLLFGDQTLLIRDAGESSIVSAAGVRMTSVQVVIIGASILTALFAWGILRFTRLGMMVRAVASDPELAAVVGVPERRVLLFVFGLGSGLAAMAAVLIAYDTDLNPMMGFHVLLFGMVAVIVGGTDSVTGALFGGWLVGLSQHVGAWVLPTQWQQAVVFIILLIFLLARPQGVFGRPSRKAVV